jgi:hypothetical protein
MAAARAQLTRIAAAFAACLILHCARADQAWMATNTAIVSPANGTAAEALAAKELRRYIYLATGQWLPINGWRAVNKDAVPMPPNLIIVAAKGQDIAAQSALDPLKARIAALDSQQYVIKALPQPHGQWLVICGADDPGVLYGAYRFLQTLGIRFYLDNDDIPDDKTALDPSGLDIDGKPLFSLRGLQPFHDFPEGPDWWNLDDYKAYIAQLPKMGMNFIGFHTYPETQFNGHWKAEPLVWIGTKDQINPDGTVKSAYPAMHSNTRDETWGYFPKKTSDFACGASQLFEDDYFGADYMMGVSEWPHTDDENIRIFDDVGKLLGNAFTFAHRLGVKTCVGTEIPLSIPANVQSRMAAAQEDPGSDAAKRDAYEGTFARIMKTYPLDYYWFWTPELWTWRPEPDDEVMFVERDLLNAIQAWRNVNAPFTLATCGWVLGPTRDRSEFDNLLPKDMPFSCINRQVGFTPIEPGFQAIQGRPKWAITWLEYDHPLTEAQLWAGRVRRDAFDAARYGCTGFMGIHWRSQILSPQIGALAQAGWGLGSWTNAYDPSQRDLPIDDYYRDWANAQFGKGSDNIAKIFTALDGGPLCEDIDKHLETHLPRASAWGMPGPGLVIPDRTPWVGLATNYAFVDQLAACEDQVHGAANRERFEYWLDEFRYMRAMARAGCALGQVDAAIQEASEQTDRDSELAIINSTIMPLREEAGKRWAEMVDCLLATVDTPAAMGTVANLELHSLLRHQLLTRYDHSLSLALGRTVPPVDLPKDYTGPSRIIIPTKRTLLETNENLNLKVILLSKDPVKSVKLYWRPLGSGGGYDMIEAGHVARGVYRVVVPATVTKGRDFEYYVMAEAGTELLKYPVTAPAQNQTVVVN